MPSPEEYEDLIKRKAAVHPRFKALQNFLLTTLEDSSATSSSGADANAEIAERVTLFRYNRQIFLEKVINMGGAELEQYLKKRENRPLEQQKFIYRSEPLSKNIEAFGKLFGCQS